MSKPEGVSVSAAQPKERTVQLSSLKPGNIFRLPGVSFEEAIGGDDACAHFYHVASEKKDGMVEVASLNWVRRRLPEETLVHPHNVEFLIHPCQKV